VEAAVTEPAPLARLRVGAEHLAALLTHLRAVYPEEGCGLLAVPEDGDLAVGWYPIRNIASLPRVRYEGEPLELLDAFLDIERRGWRLGAIVHSHPSSPARPSAEDMRQARYPSALTLIVSLRQPDAPDFGLFHLRYDQIDERALVLVEPAASMTHEG
jgi:proteasome lid subunit RPN8/RPN11